MNFWSTRASSTFIHTPFKTATFWSRRPFRIYTQQEIYFFRGLSDFGHFSVAMAKNEIKRIGPVILIILHHHFASKQFGHWHLGQLYTSEITYVVLTRIHLFIMSILTWPRTESSRNTLLPLYSLVWGQNIVKLKRPLTSKLWTPKL